MKPSELLSTIAIALILFASASCGREKAIIGTMEDYRATTQFDTEAEVSRDKMEKLVIAGTSAPVTRNVTPWKLYVLGPEKISMLEKLKTVRPALCGARNAIVICGMTGRMGKGELREFWAQDCAAATGNILLAADAMGLGANWLRVYPVQVRIQEVTAAMHLPPGEVPFAIIPVGKPDVTDETPHPETPQTSITWL